MSLYANRCSEAFEHQKEARIAMDFHFLELVVIGFGAQMIDGALGMAFGVIASSILMATGVPPAIASATFMRRKSLPLRFRGHRIFGTRMSTESFFSNWSQQVFVEAHSGPMSLPIFLDRRSNRSSRSIWLQWQD